MTTIQDIVAKVTGLENAFAELRAQLARAREESGEKSNQLTQAQADFEAAGTIIKDLKAKLDLETQRTAQLTGELERTRSELQETAQKIEQAAHLKSAATLRSLGVAPVKEEGAAGSAPGELEKQLAAITNPVARTQFYRAHKAALRSANERARRA